MTRRTRGIAFIGALILAGSAGIALLLLESGGFGRRDVGNGLDIGRCQGCSLLLITFDTVRADFLPCYGHPQDTAPRFCALAREGLLYENAICPVPRTVPSLVATMTGSLASNEKNGDLLVHYDRQRFLAEELLDAGFATAAFTDHRGLGKRNQGDIAGPHFLTRGFQEWTNAGMGRSERTGERLTELALAWLRDHSRDRFFLWIHYFDPHWDYMPAPGDERRFGFDPAGCGRATNGAIFQELRSISSELRPREGECLAALHRAEVYATDREAGRVLDELERLGRDGDTLIAISADHGEEFLDHGYLGHERTVYQELVHVPLAIRNPRDRRSGRVRGALSTVQLRGMLLAAIDGRPVPAPAEVVARTHRNREGKPIGTDVPATRPDDFALWGDGEKLILSPRTRRAELYDLEADPRERNDLGPEAARSSPLWPRMEAWLAAQRSPPAPPGPELIKMHEDIQELLEKMGYVE